MPPPLPPPDGKAILADVREFLARMDAHRAFVRRYAAYRGKIRAYFRARLPRDPASAEDLASNVFLKAYRNFDRYDAAFAFSTWIYAIARNELTDFLRARSRAPTVPLEDADDVAADGAEPHARLDAETEARRLEALLRRVPARQAEALRLRHLLLLPMPEVAARLGVTEQAARQLLSRGRRALAALTRPA